ncbi:histidine acid phosphatase [Tritrichomonas foetus]|uniref:Histidine acid phosphatase n=1 Tax=Tritrichomonas foetus TaxID=1144522 RepID=A0A1J4JYS1_9EUKA|nr:histidine acid phosphatase [Tritrichomonas foetus]|eukprot:OHT04311.1 histidine acid phosphatase [Tritrichomonas foetus]
MLFFTLLSAAFSFDDQCVGALNPPNPIPGKKLRFLQLMIRHGARSPLSAWLPQTARGYWLCDSDDSLAPRMHAAPIEHYRRFKQVFDQRLIDYLPNCRSGDLLVSGMDQHDRLGALYHKYLFETHGLFSSLPVDPNETYFRCTDIERTFRSAEGFLHGVFPPQGPNEIMDIETDTSDLSILRPSESFCKDLNHMREEYVKTDAYQNWVDSTWEIVKDFAKSLGVTQKSSGNINSVCDFLATVYCDDKRLPLEAQNETVQQACLHSIGFNMYDYYQYNSTVAGSYTMRKMVKVADQFVTDKKTKFSLLSAHDSSIASILIFLLGKNMNSWNRIPPFASHLAMELWSTDEEPTDYFIRFAMNGRDLPLEKMENQTVVKYDDFKNAYSDYQTYCAEVPV